MPEVLLPEPVTEGPEIDFPLLEEPGFIDDIAPPPPPAPEPEGPLYVGGPIAQPARLAYVEPIYPPAALKARLPGVVILQVLLGRDGGVREVTVLRPAAMGMTESAVEAVRQWRWEPALFRGQPVEVLMTVTVTFTVR
ncbi:MAG: energy transducer TonB [Acidobacteriota bacterium]